MGVCFLVTLFYFIFPFGSEDAWIWKISTMIWILNSYLQYRINARYKNLIDKITGSNAKKENI